MLPIADSYLRPFLCPSERDPILLSQYLNPASDIGPNLVAFLIAFGFKGGSPLLCSLGGTEINPGSIRLHIFRRFKQVNCNPAKNFERLAASQTTTWLWSEADIL